MVERLVLAMVNQIDSLKAPLFLSWQLTRDCDLCCLHCCTESAPGKRLPDELSAEDAMRIADDIIRNDIPYVMLCGGEPMVVPHFFALAEALGKGGVQLKIETNGQQVNDEVVERLARLPIRSVQISIDGDSQEVYERQRPGGSLAKAHAACEAIRAAELPLEITFAPTRLNIHEADAVIARARSFGAFRFNTGKLMRIGTAARQWKRLAPSTEEYRTFRDLLKRRSDDFGAAMEICYAPFTIEEGLRAALEAPPATLLVLPNGWVKVAAALPQVCADLRHQNLAAAWGSYRKAWQDEAIHAATRQAIADESRHADSNTWQVFQV